MPKDKTSCQDVQIIILPFHKGNMCFIYQILIFVNSFYQSFRILKYSKTDLKLPLSKSKKTGFQDRLSLSAAQKYCRLLLEEHSAMFSTFIKLPFVTKLVSLSIFEWSLKTGFTV